jgi:hypothetical protein
MFKAQSLFSALFPQKQRSKSGSAMGFQDVDLSLGTLLQLLFNHEHILRLVFSLHIEAEMKGKCKEQI